MNQELLQSLRKATRPDHNQLEDRVDGNRLMKPPFEASHYTRLLTAHLLFNRLINQQFSVGLQFDRSIPGWPDQDRLRALSADLEALHADLSGAEVPSLAERIPSGAFVAGLCYVAEGAAMGNQMMHKALLKLPEFSALGADRYLRHTKMGLSGRWKAFQDVLLYYLKADEAAVIAGAKTGFRYFEQIWSSLGKPA